jgi:predicted DCC family thiol-disulfide oxidoreductase YuxK
MTDASRENGWTGGQYSLIRVIFGGYLLVHFAQLLPWGAEVFSSQGVLADATSPLLHLFPNVFALWDAPAFVTGVLVVAIAASVAFAVGWFDRIAALVLFYIWACLFGANPLISNPSIPFVGWLLLAHALLPKNPYGSWNARGRPDPDGGWRFPQPIHRVAWIVMAVGYTYSGWEKLWSPSWVDGTAMLKVLENPLARPSFVLDAMLALPESIWVPLTWGALAFELLFAPLALSRRLRPWLWLGMLLLHLSLMVLIDFADLSFGMVVLQLFTFDPAWVKAKNPTEKVTLFYDGVCGLCHRAVRFVLAEDRTGRACDLAPLQSELFASSVTTPEEVPDSIVLRRADGTLLFRSAAVMHAMERLGGSWRVAAVGLRVIPAPIRDVVYKFIARIRSRLFRQPDGFCPIVPQHLRARFVS